MQSSGNIDENVVHYINKASIDLINYFNRLLIQNNCEIKSQEWILLSHIIEYPGENQKWFGDHILKDKTTTMRLIDTLEKKELIKRVADGTDRRHNLLYVTETGEILIEKTIPFITDSFQSIFSDIKNEDLKIAISVLKEIIDRISLDSK